LKEWGSGISAPLDILDGAEHTHLQWSLIQLCITRINFWKHTRFLSFKSMGATAFSGNSISYRGFVLFFKTSWAHATLISQKAALYFSLFFFKIIFQRSPSSIALNVFNYRKCVNIESSHSFSKVWNVEYIPHRSNFHTKNRVCQSKKGNTLLA